jgi:integrase
VPKLSDTKIRSAKSREKPYKLYDQDGLFLIVQPNGSRWWRQKYFIAGKEKLLSIGTYPETSLADARAKSAAIRSQVKAGADPSIQRQEQKAAAISAQANTYESVVLRWLEATGQEREWTQDHIERVKRRFEVHFFPWLGSKSIADVTDEDILGCLGRMQDKRLTDTARRALSENDSVFRWAKSPTKRIIKHNVVAELRGPDTIPKTKVRHHAALKDPKHVGGLMRAIDAYHGGFVVRCALRFLPLVFVRPGELQWSKWDEFDLDGADWRIPAERTKMREQHIVPLSKQAVEILRELHALTGPDGYVFQQARNASRPISEGRPWAEWGRGEKPISQNQVARLLKRFEIYTRDIREGHKVAKGYLRDHFADAFSRYLPAASQTATALQAHE